jgi:hypothetical protein
VLLLFGPAHDKKCRSDHYNSSADHRHTDAREVEVGFAFSIMGGRKSAVGAERDGEAIVVEVIVVVELIIVAEPIVVVETIIVVGIIVAKRNADSVVAAAAGAMVVDSVVVEPIVLELIVVVEPIVVAEPTFRASDDTYNIHRMHRRDDCVTVTIVDVWHAVHFIWNTIAVNIIGPTSAWR